MLFLSPLEGAYSENLIVFSIPQTVLSDDHFITPVSAVCLTDLVDGYPDDKRDMRLHAARLQVALPQKK